MAIEPQILYDIIRGLIEGILAAICFTYALQTRVQYPEWALHTLDHPWIIILSVIAAFAVYKLDPKASILAIIIIFAFAVDVYIFTRHPIIKNPATDTRSGAGAQWGVDRPGWWIADGSLAPSPSADRLETMGKPTASIPLSQPTYPLYHAESCGPAPFI